MFDTSSLQTMTKVFLSFLGIKIIIQNYLDLRNIRSINRHKKNVPAPFDTVISKEEYKKNIEYNLTNISFGKKARTFNLVVLLAWTILGGLDLLTNLTLHTFDTTWKNSLLLVFSFSIINQLLSLPFDIYKTFVIEEKFGFNKTTKKVFILDIFKGLF